jgi:serine/threonine protein kinase
MGELGIYHSDIKPGNIVLMKKLDSNGDIYFDIKLIDFGEASLKYEEIYGYTP